MADIAPTSNSSVASQPATPTVSPKQWLWWRRKWWLWVTLALIIVAILFVPVMTSGWATVIVSPNKTTVTKGATLNIEVKIKTPVKVNAADVVMTFPADILTVTQVSTTDTAFDVVLFEPKVDNTAGTVRFVQATPKGYDGESGLLGVVTLKAKGEGQVRMGVGSAKLVAADGTARNIYRPQTRMSLGQWLWMKVQDYRAARSS